QLRHQYPLLDIQPDKENQLIAQFDNFHLHHAQTITHTTTLPQPDLTNLIKMTPNYWHLPPDTITEIEQAPPTPVTFAFRLLIFKH
ncbi:MAG TPA: hypothetical protein VLL52_18405, partial [Anaerolineae bacterium]|nr:hypothetical protein [Anaerolineae bacterium]